MTVRRQLSAPSLAASNATGALKHLTWSVKLYILMSVLPVAFYAGPVFLTAQRAFLVVLIVPLLIGFLSGRYGRVNVLDIALILHLLWQLLSFAVTAPQALLGFQGAATIEALGSYLLARAMIRDRQSFTALCKAIGLVAVAMLPIALYETFTSDPIVISFIRSLPGVTSVEIVMIEQRLGLDRVQGVFAHPIHFGLFTSIAFSLTFVAMQGKMSGTQRYIQSAIIALCTFLALSSGALLALALQIGLIAWFTMLQKYWFRWWILFGLFALAYVGIDILSSRSPIRVFMSYATFSPGTAYWRGLIFEWGIKNVLGDASNNIPAAPWFGIGLADWVRPIWMRTSSVDNFWLVVALRHGLPALILLWIGYFWLIFKVGLRHDMNGDEEFLRLRRAWMFTFIGLTFTLTTVHIWSVIYALVFFFLGAGVWMLKEQPVQAGAEGTLQAEDAVQPPRSRYSRFPIRPGLS